LKAAMSLRTQTYPQGYGRSTVLGTNGAIATSQPLAAQVGLSVLKEGGNAFDAAVAAAATLDVVEPMGIGIGGDSFVLCYLAESREVKALNASGYAPSGLTRRFLVSQGYKSMPELGIHTVTVPGALRGWAELIERFGSFALSGLLEPAITYAEDGFPVTEIIASAWRKTEHKLRVHADTARALLNPDGTAPSPGQVFRQPELAATYRAIASEGPDAFYEGDPAKAIVELSRSLGGTFELKDLAEYRPEWVEPISTTYRGCEILECPPNGQGIAALIALNIIENDDLASLGHNTAAYLHLLVEAKRLAYADRDRYVADPRLAQLPVQELLSKEYARQRRKLIDDDFAAPAYPPGVFPRHEDTAYVTVVDRFGNACSLIGSLYMSFASGLVAGRTGVCLQNRGAGFALEQNSPNCVGPRKRPFHTIIPGMVLRGGQLYLSYGLIGGHMQPQGHIQLICNILDFGMTSQEALEAPRFFHLENDQLGLEWPISPEVRARLADKGHQLSPPGDLYGGGQLIMRHPDTGVLSAGSDPRKDGCALAY